MKETNIEGTILKLIREIRAIYEDSVDSVRMPVDEWMRVRGVTAIAERGEVDTLAELLEAMRHRDYTRFFTIANRPALLNSEVIDNNEMWENGVNNDLNNISSRCNAAREQLEQVRAEARAQITAQFKQDIDTLPMVHERSHIECPRALQQRIDRFIQNENTSLTDSDEATLHNINNAIDGEREKMTSIATSYLNAIKSQTLQDSESSKTDAQQTSNIDEALSLLHEMYEETIEYISSENVQHAQAMLDDAVQRLKEDRNKQEEITDKFFADLQLCRAGVLSRNGDSMQGELCLGTMKSKENEQSELHLGTIENFDHVAGTVLSLLSMGTLASMMQSHLQ